LLNVIVLSIPRRSEAFDDDGFFRTGDTVQLSGSPSSWKIVGRTSVDIIKYSGYKVGAKWHLPTQHLTPAQHGSILL
jgi:non-ribosomal peptide synthetase component E (peptide arylation enzyme)